MVKTGEFYRVNYTYGDISLKTIGEYFPVFRECKFGFLGMGSSVPEGWNYVNLGMGNHLIVKDEVYSEFFCRIC